MEKIVGSAKVIFGANKINYFYTNDTLIMHTASNAKKVYNKMAEKLSGDVLLVGLGASNLLNAVDAKADVTSITVIEINQDLISLCKEIYNYSEKVTFICADVYNIELGDSRFDSLHIDTTKVNASQADIDEVTGWFIDNFSIYKKNEDSYIGGFEI